MKSILENTMEITQRTATLDDAEVLLAWRNNPRSREFSQHSELISPAEHLEWLSKRLERVNYEPYFIFLEGSKQIGMSRLDLVPGLADRYEISILVDPSQQGRGTGARILKMTCDSLSALLPIRTILAKVHVNNFISTRLFENAGFVSQTQLGHFLYFQKLLN